MANTTGGDKVFVVPWTTDRMLKIPGATPASNLTIYGGQAVGRDASGNMVQMDDTAKAEFLGFCTDVIRQTILTDATVTTNGRDGDYMFLVEQPQMFTALIASAAAGDEGRKVYWLYNNQVSYSPGNSANFAGYVWFVKDSTHVTVLPPWLGSVTGGGDLALFSRAATGTVALTKWDVNKVILMPLTAGATTTLPPAAACSPGDIVRLINTSANSSIPTIAAAGSDTINGAATYTQSTSQYAGASFRTDGVSKWYVELPGASGTVGATTFNANSGTSSATFTVSDNVANTFAVGPNGATNPALTVDCSVSSAATGIDIIGRAAGAGVTLQVITSGTNEDLLVATAGTGGVKITSPGASALAVGRLGGTTPALVVDASTATCVTGMKLKAAASGAGFALSFVGGTNEVVTVDTNGSGSLNFQYTGTGVCNFGSGALVTGGSNGIGYGTGVGGTVTQITSRTTGVTLSKLSGTITLVSAAGSATAATFTVTNTLVAATDTPVVTQKSGTDAYTATVSAVAAGSFKVTIVDLTGTTTESPVFNMNVLKGVAA